MFPYGSVDLAHLEDFDATQFELDVVGNPGFVHLRKFGFPKWGQLIIGGEDYFTSATPKSLGKFVDQFAADVLRSVAICAAAVRRDLVAHPEAMADKRDQQLLTDLRIWLNARSTDYADRFRWEKHWTALQQRTVQLDWTAQAAAEMTGTSDMIVFLTRSLPSASWQELGQIVDKHVREIHSVPEDGIESFRMARYTFWPKCLHCEGGEPGQGHPSRCSAHHLLPVLDCGRSVKDVMAWLPRELQKQLSAVRFRLPRSTFYNDESARRVMPRFLCFDLHTLQPDTQMRVYASINDLIEEQKRLIEREPHRSHRFKWHNLEIIGPTGSKPPSVVLAAGKNAHEARVHDVNDPLEQRGLKFHELISRGMTVSIVGA